jgi:hypothetical protein
MLGGAGLMLAHASYVHDPGLNVPPAIGYLVAGVFGCAALAMLHRAAGREAPVGLAALMLVGLAGIGGWIGLGPGERSCVAGTGSHLLAVTGGATCRVAFGGGAVLTSLMAGWALRAWWRTRRGR